MLAAVEGIAPLLLYIVATIYAGELIWRERDTHFELIHDALPMRGWIDTLSKLVALGAAEFFLLTLVLICGVISQAISGYFHFELIQYAEELYLIVFSQVMIFALAGLLHSDHRFQQIHRPRNRHRPVPAHRHSGYGWASTIGFTSTATWSHYTYSDMNGYGHFVSAASLVDRLLAGLGGAARRASSLLGAARHRTGLRARLSAAKHRCPRMRCC